MDERGKNFRKEKRREGHIIVTNEEWWAMSGECGENQGKASISLPLSLSLSHLI